ncbi:hypothetical protein SAMN05880593_12117 [Rhizobium sp. RU36D]|nr:hypothetical protein SAMN05880593_12117 [Rhizobium sp. RU36D]
MQTTAFLRPALSRGARIAILAATMVGAAMPAFAADVTFMMQNDHPNAVEVELYSQDRNHVWPGGNQVYYLDDGETKQIPLSCNQGETICYGAWIAGDRGTYWGTGPDNAESCSDCCYVCEGGETETIRLVQ